MEIFKLFGSILINTDQADKSLAKTDKSAKSFMGVFGKYVSKVLGWFGAITSVSSAIRDVIKTGLEFDAQISKVGAISGATGKDLDDLRKKAKEMGAATKFSATESGKAFEYMAMAGWKTQDMLDGISGVMNLAAASGESLATTSDIVTDALTAFGLKADASAHFADVLAVASSNANTNVSMMGETFKYVAPVAGSMNYSIEDTAEAIGLMANAGIKASQAGTSLRSIITRLATNAGKTKTELGALDILVEKLGVQFYNADGSARDFGDVINETREAWKKLNDQDATAFAKKIAGQYGIAGWLSLMNAAPDDINKLSEAIKNADGAAQKMADTMQDNLAGDITIFKSALEGLKIELSDQVAPVLRQFVQIGTNLMPMLTDLTRPIFEITARLMEKLVPVIQKLVDKLLPPIVGIIEDLMPLIEIALDILDPVLDLVLAFIDPIADILKMLSPILDFATLLINEILKPLKPLLEGVATVLVNLLGGAISEVTGLVSNGLIPIFKGLIDFLNGDFETGISEAGEGFINVFSGALGIIDGLFGTNLKKWYEDVTAFWRDAGAKLYEVLHADEINAREQNEKVNDMRTDIILASNQYMREGMDAAEALAKAKNEVLNTTEELALFNAQLADTLTEEEARQRQRTLKTTGQINSFDASNYYSSHYSTPHLATGGVVYGKTLAVVGDNKNVKSDPEVVSPLSDLNGMIGNDKVLAAIERLTDVIIQAVNETTPITLSMDGQKVATAVTNRINTMRFARGAEVVL